MSAPIVVKSTDSGAPDLNGTDGSLYDVLKYALPLIGWTIEFDDEPNHQIAFRNDPSTGTGYYLKLYDNEADHAADSRRGRFEGYASMSDINTGGGVFPSSQVFCMKSHVADATAKEWMVVGNEKCFWFFPYYCDHNKVGAVFFGDINSRKPGDTTNFVIGLGTTTSTSGSTVVMPMGFNTDGTSDYDGFWIAESYDGSVVGQYCYARYGFQVDGTEYPTNSFYSGHTQSDVYPTDPITGGYRVGYIEIVENNGDVMRGILPGFLAIANNIYSEYDWGTVFDPLVPQTIANQETPHGQITMQVQNIDRGFDFSNDTSPGWAYVGGWDFDSDWDLWTT